MEIYPLDQEQSKPLHIAIVLLKSVRTETLNVSYLTLKAHRPMGESAVRSRKLIALAGVLMSRIWNKGKWQS